MFQRVTLIDRVLSDDTTALKANKISTDFGFKPARNREQLRENLRVLITDKNAGPNALMRLGAIHPDKELILSAVGGSEEKMGCDGCGGTCGDKLNIVAGGPSPSPNAYADLSSSKTASNPSENQNQILQVINANAKTILWATAFVISSVIIGKAIQNAK